MCRCLSPLASCKARSLDRSDASRPSNRTNPIERLNDEVKRSTEVVGIFPNDEAIMRLVGALLLEQNDELAVQRSRYMTLETIAPSVASIYPRTTC